MIRKALLVGINKYQLIGCNLNGCVNDVYAMKGILIGLYGFAEKDITVLIDEQATRRNILSALSKLVWTDNASLVFHYSGHGTQVYGGDDADGMDEALCPHDMQDADGVIRDTLLADYIKQVPPTSHLTFISDSCHSGTIDRDFKQAKRRYINTPGIVASHHERKPSKVRALMDQRHVLISGCRDNQTSADASIGGTYHGALTYALAWAIKSDPMRNPRQIHADACEWLRSNRYSQEPQLSGPRALTSAQIFTGKQLNQEPTTPI